MWIPVSDSRHLVVQFLCYSGMKVMSVCLEKIIHRYRRMYHICVLINLSLSDLSMDEIR